MFQKIIDFSLTELVNVLTIIVVAILVYFFISSVLRKMIGSLIKQAKRNKRIITLEKAFFGTARFTIIIIVFLMIISELGFNIGPLLAGAGLLGLAVSMGSKEIVGDFLSGIFILLDDLYRVGDEVKISGTEGKVVSIDLRKTVIQDDKGIIHIIPNGKIKEVAKK